MAHTAAAPTPPIDTSAIHARFIRTAGLTYGAIVALGFGLIFWGLDALALQQAAATMWWSKLALGLLICVPLGMIIGWLAARVHWSAISIGLWIIGGMAFAWIGGRIPYDGLSWLARLSDPYPPAHSMYPISMPSIVLTGFCMVIGAIAGLFVGLISLVAVERAWNSSTAHHRLGVRSLLMLLIGLPPIMLGGAFADFQINSTVRSAYVEIDQMIKTTLNPKVDLNEARLTFMAAYRDRLSPNYSLIWNTTSDDLSRTTLDVQFTTGLMLRCPHAFGGVAVCANISQDVNDWMTQLMTTGHLTCVGCYVQVDRDTRRWLAASLPTIGRLRDVQMWKHQGGWIYMRATFDSGQKIDCRFSRDRPVVVDLCLEAK